MLNKCLLLAVAVVCDSYETLMRKSVIAIDLWTAGELSQLWEIH